MINSFSIKAVIASENVATGAAAARRIVCTACRMWKLQRHYMQILMLKLLGEDYNIHEKSGLQRVRGVGGAFQPLMQTYPMLFRIMTKKKSV